MRNWWTFVGLALALLAAPAAAWAHVGATGVYVQGSAGPYKVYVTVSPPPVIPGEASVSVFSEDPRVTGVAAGANVLLQGQPGQLPSQMPAALPLTAGPAGTHEWHGTVWVMTPGSWQVQVRVRGAGGAGTLAVPLPATPVRQMRMSRRFGGLLIVLGGLLLAGMASLAAAAVREAGVAPDAVPTVSGARKGRWAAVGCVLAVGVLLFAGNKLWTEEIARTQGNVYHPLKMTTTVGADGEMELKLAPQTAFELVASGRRLDDLVLDHNHLMHLYLMRWPAMDQVYHLHPVQVAAGDFRLALPRVEPGDYRLYADVVHADGFPETAVADVHLPAEAGRALVGDDAYGALPAASGADRRTFRLPDGYGYKLAVETPGGTPTALRAGVPVMLAFTLLDPAGRAPKDMANYMGMLGHVAIVKDDGAVFAHIHPEGSAAMAAYMLANASAKDGGMAMGEGPLGSVASFPFGFPKAGGYRLVVQMKHGETVETGAVDVVVR